MSILHSVHMVMTSFVYIFVGICSRTINITILVYKSRAVHSALRCALYKGNIFTVNICLFQMPGGPPMSSSSGGSAGSAPPPHSSSAPQAPPSRNMPPGGHSSQKSTTSGSSDSKGGGLSGGKISAKDQEKAR